MDVIQFGNLRILIESDPSGLDALDTASPMVQ